MRHSFPHTPPKAKITHTPSRCSRILPFIHHIKTKRNSIQYIHPSLSLTQIPLPTLLSPSLSLSLREAMEDLPQGYRPKVGVCLINSDDQVFVASKLSLPGAWQMPQGQIEDDEDPKDAAIRELREATGIVSAEIVAEAPRWFTSDFPPAVKAKVNRLWGGDWHGHAQKWFLMRFTKDETEVNLAYGETDPEFGEWKWASPEEVIEQGVDHKRAAYEEVLRIFKPYFQGNAISAKCKSSKW